MTVPRVRCPATLAIIRPRNGQDRSLHIRLGNRIISRRILSATVVIPPTVVILSEAKDLVRATTQPSPLRQRFKPPQIIFAIQNSFSVGNGLDRSAGANIINVGNNPTTERSRPFPTSFDLAVAAGYNGRPRCLRPYSSWAALNSGMSDERRRNSAYSTV